MKKQLWNVSRPPTWILLIAASLLASQGLKVSAQQITLVRSTALEAPPMSKGAQPPGPLSLDACLDLGQQHQPALDAARASLAATEAGKRGIDRLLIPRLFKPELSVRRQQACQGLSIAVARPCRRRKRKPATPSARNFFTVQYIRSQCLVVDDVLRNLDTGYKRAEKLFKSGDPDVKITQIDLDAIKVQIGLVKSKKSQVENGMLKALAALREAIGLKYDYPLDIAAVPLPGAGLQREEGEGRKGNS